MKITTDGYEGTIEINGNIYEFNSSDKGELVLCLKDRLNNPMGICEIGGGQKSVLKSNILFIKPFEKIKRKTKRNKGNANE